MTSSKHFCDFCGLEIEKNESASILRFPPARMCVRSLLLKGCRSCTAPLDVEIWAMVRPSHLGRIVLTPCCRNFESIIRATSETTLQAGFQDKRNYLCLLAGVEIEKCAAIVHGMSNQRSEKPDLPQHKPGSPWSLSWLPTTSQLHFFSQCKLYLEQF